MFLAVDLGTTGCRSILFDKQLQPLGQAYGEYPLHLPREGWAEQDPQDWWHLLKKTAREAAEKAGISLAAVDSLAISSQGITVVPVDEGFAPLYPAMTWLDLRAADQAERIGRECPTLYEVTGKPPTAPYTLPKLLWLRENEPEIWASARYFLMPMDYLQAKLTGKVATDHSMACGTALYDLQKGTWSEQIARQFAIPTAKLPPILPAGTALGTVLPEVAEELGLSPQCLVAVGGQDQKCAAFGAGLDETTVTVSLGTAASITSLRSTPAPGSCGYVLPQAWVWEGVLDTAGVCLRWIRDLLFPEGYDALNREAEACLDTSKLVFLPELADGGGAFSGMTLGTRRGHMALAVMEGVAFRVQALLQDKRAGRLVLFGGGAKSSLWCRILADVTGLPVCVPTTAEAASAGAARLAAKAMGVQLPPLQIAHEYLPGTTGSHKRAPLFWALDQERSL